jgi:hypothetical protein
MGVLIASRRLVAVAVAVAISVVVAVAAGRTQPRTAAITALEGVAEGDLT